MKKLLFTLITILSTSVFANNGGPQTFPTSTCEILKNVIQGELNTLILKNQDSRGLANSIIELNNKYNGNIDSLTLWKTTQKIHSKDNPEDIKRVEVYYNIDQITVNGDTYIIDGLVPYAIVKLDKNNSKPRMGINNLSDALSQNILPKECLINNEKIVNDYLRSRSKVDENNAIDHVGGDHTELVDDCWNTVIDE